MMVKLPVAHKSLENQKKKINVPSDKMRQSKIDLQENPEVYIHRDLHTE